MKMIKAARVVDGRGGPPLERGAVLVDGDTIRAVGEEAHVVPPDGAGDVEVLEYGDRTVLPGLVDCHVHLIGIGDGRAGDELTLLPDEVLTLQAARNARAHLFSGVTTVRDCGAKNRTTLMLRRAVDMGVTFGPRMLLSGRPMAIIGGHLSYFGVQATGPDECRAAVRQLIKEGVDFIKITATGGSTRTSFRSRPSFDPDEIGAICDEAHKLGKHTVAHCASSQGMVNALDAGVDTIVHAVFKEPDDTNRFRPEIAERLAEQGVFVNPTLRASGRDKIEMLKSMERSKGLDPQERMDLDRLSRNYDHMVECFGLMRDAGVTLVCGSDSAWGGYPMGLFQHEIEEHAAAGMSPMEAITSATADSARSCRLDGTVGTLQPGKRADLLVVDGDPTVNIGGLWNVVDVFQGGRRVDRGSAQAGTGGD